MDLNLGMAHWPFKRQNQKIIVLDVVVEEVVVAVVAEVEVVAVGLVEEVEVAVVAVVVVVAVGEDVEDTDLVCLQLAQVWLDLV